MKVFVPNYEPNRIGGGWTWTDNFVKGMGDEVTFDYDEAEVFIIPSASMVSHEQVNKAREDKKKIVLRADNALRDSRNRGTGMSRLKAFSEVADLVIYQSEWAKNFLMPFTKKDGAVILNGVDTKRFNSNNRMASDDSYLYVRSSRDEGKQWIMAWYWFVNNTGHLDIVGRFSDENLEWNFDFYNGEKFTFWGEQPNMVDFYKRNKYFLYTYTNDACSNTLIESLFSGCGVIDVYHSLTTGGAPEIMEAWKNDRETLTVEGMLRNYKRELEKLV